MDKLNEYLNAYMEVERCKSDMEDVREKFIDCGGTSSCRYNIPRNFVAWYQGVPYLVKTNPVGQIESVQHITVAPQGDNDE